MRYFKFNSAEPCSPAELQSAYEFESTSVSPKEERRLRWKSRLSTFAFWLVTLGVFIGCIAVSQLFRPVSEGLGWRIFNEIVKGVWIVCGAILGAVLGLFASLLFSAKTDESASKLKHIHASRRCTALREYYGLGEPCLVTKCFDASDKTFVNHDVCLFVADGELRLTTNLKNGVFAGDKDLGCYAFTREEIVLSQAEKDHFLATELKGGGAEFILGIRAKRFVETQFLK